MKTARQIRNNLALCLIAYLLSYVLWSAWQLHASPKIVFGNGFVWLEVLVKGLIWIGPFLLSVLSKKDGWLELPGRMFCTSFPFIPFLGMFCATVCFLYTVRVAGGLQDTYLLWDWNYLLFSVSAGVIEEISFRGFFFNRMAKPLGVIPAALANGMMFAFYHYPEVILRLQFAGIFSLRFVMLYVVGVLFCLAFAKWRNLWLTILVHSAWNLISYLWALAG